MKWPLLRLGRPIEARNADGTSNKGGMIQYQVDLNLRIEDRNSSQCFFVIDLGNKNTIILGHPWLTKTNPLINWTAGTVRMRGTPVVTVEEAPISFSPFSPTNCTLYSHFSFDDFIRIAFPDLTRDLDDQI